MKITINLTKSAVKQFVNTNDEGQQVIDLERDDGEIVRFTVDSDVEQDEDGDDAEPGIEESVEEESGDESSDEPA